MKIFLDTEFTSLENPALISIGMISEDGKHQIYLEIEDYLIDSCSDFVKNTVLPLLGYGKKVRHAEVKDFLSKWFAMLPDQLEMCCDSDYDKNLFAGIFADNLPPNIVAWYDLYPLFDHPDFSRAVRKYHALAERQHHALHDAIALQRGWIAAYPSPDKKET